MTKRQESEISKFYDVISQARHTNDECILHETMAYIINHVHIIASMDTPAGRAANIMAKALDKKGIKGLPIYSEGIPA